MLENDLKRLFLLEQPKVLPDLRLVNRVVGRFEIRDGATGRHRPVHVGIKGLCDLYGWRRGGHAVEVELKAYGGRMRPEQEKWRVWCLAWGIEHFLLTAGKSEEPMQTVKRWIEEVRA